MDSTWKTVEELRTWLDGHAPGPPEHTALLRVLKLSEEVGEVAEAVIGAHGHNPRKGRSHTWTDLQAELCDVIVTAMVALRTLTPDAPAVFAHHLNRVHIRSRPPGARPSEPPGEPGTSAPGNTTERSPASP
ncbi:MazG-like family protein [Streptomyces fradiae]|uniref:MazG-like family protein n=1 Tax=Streptomyces fradiae TaxID=1906 RepID=UPI0037A8E1D6